MSYIFYPLFRVYFLSLIVLFFPYSSIPADSPPSIILIGEISMEDDLDPELEKSIKNIILSSIRKYPSKSNLTLEGEWIQTQIEHIQKNKLKIICTGRQCEDNLIENLDINLKIQGKFTQESGKSRLILKLINIENKKVLNTKEVIFADYEMEYYIDECVKGLLNKSYKPNFSEGGYDRSFQFPEMKISPLNSDLRIFINYPNEKISSLLKNYERKILQADSKYREGNIEFSYNTYLYVYNNIKTNLSPLEQKNISDYMESLQLRLQSSALHLVSLELKVLDKNIRNNIDEPEKLNQILKDLQNLYSTFKSSGINDPEIEDAIIGRSTKLEFLLVKAYEKKGNYYNYYGKFNEAEKSYQTLKLLILENKNLKNLNSYLNGINKKIEKNQIDSQNSSLSRMITLYHIAEKENFNRYMALKKGDLLFSEGSYQEIKLCLERAEGILVSQKKEVVEIRYYYNRILDILKNKSLSDNVVQIPKRESPYFVNYSLLWNSIYFPGLGQIQAFPDEDKSRTLFYSGIMAFSHLIYRGSVYYGANLNYQTAQRINPIYQLTLDNNTRTIINYIDYSNFQNLKNEVETASQNFSISAGLFGFIYLISLGDVLSNYSRLGSTSFIKFNNFNQNSSGLYLSAIPSQQKGYVTSKNMEEVKYEFSYIIQF